MFHDRSCEDDPFAELTGTYLRRLRMYTDLVEELGPAPNAKTSFRL